MEDRATGFGGLLEDWSPVSCLKVGLRIIPGIIIQLFKLEREARVGGNWFLVKMERKVFMMGPERPGNDMVLTPTTALNFRLLKGRVVRGVMLNHSQTNISYRFLI